MRLDDEDSVDDLKLVSGTHGMNVPNACTIVIIAGYFTQKHLFKNDFEINILSQQHKKILTNNHPII